MIERFLKQTKFTSEQDFKEHLEFIIPEDFNFAYDVMDEWAKIKPDHVALLWTSERGEEIRFTYKDLKEQSDKAAAYFQSLGIGHDDKVMLILKRHYQWWLAMLGLHKLGAVAIPATHMLTKHDIVYRNNAASVKAIICCGDDYVVEQVNQAMPESPTVKTLISIGPDIPEGFHDWMKEWNECAPFVRPEHVNSNEDTLLMYFTSGTTGEPKMVAHDHLYALGHLTTGVYWHNLHENSIHLTVADTGWGKAVWGKLYGQWFAGATVFVFDHEKFTADKIMRQIEKYHITSFCAPPTIYRFMIQEDFSKYDLNSLEYCTTAGEAMNPSVAETFQKLTGVQIYEGFGQTETTMTLGTFPWIKPKPGSMGKPNPQYDVHILRPDMTECEDGEKGEICIRIGDDKPIGLFKYYYRDEKQTKSVWHDGYYHTGDMAWRDEEGYFWFEGRIDDVIKSSGYRIGPFEVENALMTHPAVVECAITGVPDPIRGMVVKATVVLKDEYKSMAGPDLIKKLQDHVKHETAPYKYPRIIEFVDELPKTISGKIRRVEIREKDNKKIKKNALGGQVLFPALTQYVNIKEFMRRIVVKVGSNVLTREDRHLNVTRMSALVDQLAWLRRHDYEVILVSSGAVMAGRGELQVDHQLDSVEQRQLFSSVGQGKLIRLYYDLFREYNIKVGQVLTMKENFLAKEQYQNQKACMELMLENGVLPIVNENDTVCLTELMFTDNDELSGLIARMLNADALVLLSNVDGIYNGDPSLPTSRIIPSVYYDRDVSEYVSDEKSSHGRGGMISKLKTAQDVANAGIKVIIANGNTPNILIDLKEHPMETLHTEFAPRPQI